MTGVAQCAHDNHVSFGIAGKNPKVVVVKSLSDIPSAGFMGNS
jgi:hypothetical protein